MAEPKAAQYVSLVEAASILGVHPNTVRKHIAAGRLAAYRAPVRRSTLRLRIADVEAFLRPVPTIR